MSEGGTSSELPEGWIRVRLGDILARIEAGKSYKCEPRPASAEEWGVIKVSAMTWGDFDEGENKAVPLGFPINPDYEIRPGDILLSRANTAAYVGASVLVRQCRPRLLLSDKSLRLVPAEGVDREWLAYLLSSPEIRSRISARATGTKDSMRNISQGALSELECLLPPLEEQQRIVVALEEQLSRLDAAVANLGAAVARTRPYLRSLLREMIPDVAPQHWESSTVGDAGTVELGRQRHPDWHNGPNMRPYLRVANVYEDRIDVSDLKEMDFSGVFEKFRLHSGDVLLNEGQSPELVGRPAIYRGEPPNVAFTNSLIRFRGRPGVLPEWALLVFRRHMHVGRFKREARITTNIAHLSAARLKGIEFPIPPVSEQEQLIKLASERFSALDRMIAALRKQQQQAAALRRSLLAEAFAGRLVPQDPADEPATVLLERIRAEREAAGAAKPRRRAPRRAPAQRARTQGAAPATDAPPPPRADAPSLAAATQPTLDLEMPS
ncbi:restriction endonuclease subunit S [Streptomyces fradiae]|uniref:restriction endonuclease subunit S n=1 Tax=Streptomyces fradiae TaxID=1906 RepID=UPI0036FCDDA6